MSSLEGDIEYHKLFNDYQKAMGDYLRWCMKLQVARRLNLMDWKECFKCKHNIINGGICDPL